MSDIGKKRILELFDVNTESGIITRKTSRGSRPAGGVAGTVRPDGYIQLSIDNKSYLAHRLIFLIAFGFYPEQVDHINGVKNDNRSSNLRAADNVTNARNQKMNSANKTGIAGVRYRESRNAYEAYWDEGGGRKRYKYFSCITYGHDSAKSLAIEYRSNQIKRLNSIGFGYTDRHGIES